MTEERLQMLQKFVEEDPNDPFNLYSLGLACLDLDLEKGILSLKEVQNKFPDYLPVYYPLAQALQEKEPSLALMMYESGIQLAEQLNQLKTKAELQSARMAWEIEMED